MTKLSLCLPIRHRVVLLLMRHFEGSNGAFGSACAVPFPMSKSFRVAGQTLRNQGIFMRFGRVMESLLASLGCYVGVVTADIPFRIRMGASACSSPPCC
jgi:hypothetical protein